MTRRTARRPPGAWRRFSAALAAFVVVMVGVPALLVLFSRLGLDASHPIPGIGTSDEIKSYFERDLTPTEIAPIAMRGLLIAGWVLWSAMAVSVLASILEARGSGLRTAFPQFAMFAGMGRWIAAGLTAVSALAPNFVSAASLASPRPFTVSSATASTASVVERPVASGFARVQRGESVETFAQRTLGAPSRWTEIWNLNKDQAVGQDGETWSVAWKLSAGWDLKLPAGDTTQPTFAAMAGAAHGHRPSVEGLANDVDIDQPSHHEVAAGDSYWSIARSQLGDGASGPQVWDYTQLLMEANAPRLAYDDPAMLQPGDVVDVIATPVATSLAPAVDATAPAHAVPHITVEAGDSYWEIAEDALGPDATPQSVLELTNDLVDLNSPILGHEVRSMIHPGDTVFLHDPATLEPPPVEPVVMAAAPVAEVVDGGLDPDVDLVEPTGGTLSSTTVPTTAPSTAGTTTIPPPVTPDPPAGTDVDGRRPSTSPIGVGEAALLATGIVALLAARRRARLRAAELPARLPLPRPENVATERMLRRLEDGERLLRVDIALRATAAAISDTEQRVVVVRSGPDGTIELTMSGPVALDEPWLGSDRRWTLPRLVQVDELAAQARTVGVPCIALVQVGVDEHGWDVLLDLEAVGLLAVNADAPTADAVVRAVAVGLASSEFAEVAHLVGVGVDQSAFLGHRQAQCAGSLDEGIELAATLVGTTLAAKRSTFALRARHTGGELWEPAVVLVASSEAIAVSPTVAASLSGRGGIAMVAGGTIPGAFWNLRPDGQMWSLDPLGIRLTPVGIDMEELAELVDAIDGDPLEADAADTVLNTSPSAPVIPERHALLVSGDPHLAVVDGAVPGFDTISIPASVGAPDSWLEPVGHGDINGHNGTDSHATVWNNGDREGQPALTTHDLTTAQSSEEFQDPAWSMMVRLMGTVDLVDTTCGSAKFERSKTLELLTWMVTHRQGSTRIAARTALWDQDVRDATFANVVSEARRAMARQVEPPEGDEWLRRTLTDELALHEEIVCDADLVRARFDLGRGQSDDAALRTLKPAVELIRELPFTGTSYLWPETEGIASNLVVLATNVSAEYAKRALAAGDFEGVFWATGQGLKVLAGQEGLIALRMRAHAVAGDLSGVRLEWETYERVINADPWSDGEPAPKLVALRKELLSR